MRTSELRLWATRSLLQENLERASDFRLRRLQVERPDGFGGTMRTCGLGVHTAERLGAMNTCLLHGRLDAAPPLSCVARALYGFCSTLGHTDLYSIGLAIRMLLSSTTVDVAC
ncbi:hypothetical protein WJX81_003506 [Elliptochloris bilobata]|uniref:Uncharacterized protein n=1 Tax=Elliptochloris bilobata TaxID=381761 RepID=A0AAW1QMI3_9CHLO